MKFSTLIPITFLIISIAQIGAAQNIDIPNKSFEPAPILSAAFQVLENVDNALNVIDENCDIDPPRGMLRAENLTVWPLAKNPKIINYISTCRRQLKEKGAHTKGTEAIFILINKALSFTKHEWELIKTLGPNDVIIKNFLKK